LKKKLTADFGANAPGVATPRNYVVPDFGVDKDIIATTNSISTAEKKLGKKVHADFGANASNVATPRNYVVPDFGVDKDIIATTNSISTAETSQKHTWAPTKAGGFW